MLSLINAKPVIYQIGFSIVDSHFLIFPKNVIVFNEWNFGIPTIENISSTVYPCLQPIYSFPLIICSSPLKSISFPHLISISLPDSISLNQLFSIIIFLFLIDLIEIVCELISPLPTSTLSDSFNRSISTLSRIVQLLSRRYPVIWTFLFAIQSNWRIPHFSIAPIFGLDRVPKLFCSD